MTPDQARGGLWVVVPAAGRGTRFGAERPKQHVEVGGRSLLAHTLDALATHPGIAGLVLVLAAGDPFAEDAASPAIADKAVAGKPLQLATGGESRADSVLAGLAALPEHVRADDFVLVHDAARPNLAASDLDALLERGRGDPVGAILAAPVRDTLKRAGDDGGIDGTEPRERLWRALTPQMFRRLQLARALEAARDAGIAITDEAMAMERQGARPLLIEGREDNFKITTPADLARFEFVLSHRG